MKKIQPTLQLFSTLAISLAPLTGNSQYHSGDETTIGIEVESNFSGFNYNGITPSLTIGCNTYQLQFGPRFSFQQMAGNTNENEHHQFWDIGYSYSFFQQDGLSLFGAIRVEYDSYRHSEDWFYEYPTFNPGAGLYLADYSFNAQTAEHLRYFNAYLGAGAEYILVDKLYITAFGGAGLKTISGYSHYSNADTGEQIQQANYFLDKQGASWIASVGIGYRL